MESYEVQLKDFKKAEQELTGKERVFISQDNNTRSTTIDEIRKPLAEQLNEKAYYVTPQMFGAVGNGVTDDTTALKNCLTYAQTNQCRVIGGINKKYLISETLEIKNLHIDFNNSTITSNIDCGALLSINVIDNTNRTDYYGILENVKLDCSNVDKGLLIQMGRKKLIRDVKFENIKHYGLYYATGYEITIRDCHFKGNGTSDTIAIQANCGDSNFSDCIIIDCYKAIVNRGLNFYKGIHAWMSTHSLAPKASMFVCGANSPCYVNQCYSDTYGITFNMEDGWVIVNQLQIYFNTDIYEETYTSPYLFYLNDNCTSYHQRKCSITQSELKGVGRHNQNLQYCNLYPNEIKVNYNNISKVNGYNACISTNTSQVDYLNNIVEIVTHRRTVKNGFVNINLVFKIDTSVSKNFKLCDIPYFLQPNGEYNSFCCWGIDVNGVSGVGSLKITDTISGTIITDETFTGNRAYIKINAIYPIVSEFIEY